MASRRPTRKTRRRWRRRVGLIGPSDIKALQSKVDAYRSRLRPFAINAPLTPAPSSSKFTIIDWQELDRRTDEFLAEPVSTWNPIDYVVASGVFKRGRDLVTELDAWHDELLRLGVRNVPPPRPGPDSELDLAGGIGFALAAIVGLMLLRDLR